MISRVYKRHTGGRMSAMVNKMGRRGRLPRTRLKMDPGSAERLMSLLVRGDICEGLRPRKKGAGWGQIRRLSMDAMSRMLNYTRWLIRRCHTSGMFRCEPS
jgi:hypothetical protein